ncbi:MAG: hypothetical protein M3373_13955 [Gemmatimonadota bacterium]|nr:hypothetical protein [Gemmatimonadota bacterium]
MADANLLSGAESGARALDARRGRRNRLLIAAILIIVAAHTLAALYMARSAIRGRIAAESQGTVDPLPPPRAR